MKSVVSAKCLKFGLLTVATLLVSCRPSFTETPLKYSDAIVLLAGNHSERAPVAAALFRAGYAKRVLLTNDGIGGGWSKKYDRNLTMIEWAEDELVYLGVPRSSIVKLPFYRSGTMYDALAVIQYARRNSLNRLILVTSDYHAKRSLWCFRRFSENSHMEISVSPVKGSDNGLLKSVSESMEFVYYAFRFVVLHMEPHLDDVDHTGVVGG